MCRGLSRDLDYAADDRSENLRRSVEVVRLTSSPGNYGFAFFDGTLTPPTIVDVALTGPRGNLRDSDATPSLHGYTLYNWAVHFAIAVQG